MLNWGAQPYIHGNCDENGICQTGIFVIQSFVISGRINNNLESRSMQSSDCLNHYMLKI